MFFLKETRRKPVNSLKDLSLKGVGLLIEQEAVKQSRYPSGSYLFVLNFSARYDLSSYNKGDYSGLLLDDILNIYVNST